ncbi:transforming growth factor-beta-induced protein ig-h3 [Trichonephila clavipes]|uniref:Transforming growth factor-beta-induced protein ig-h3 n=1 Tax=Trichonephila clavipes TaxID=2585209 RepID=A0A8X6RCG6_TRICX|nr:transforming growth factor-beta-induced protein ig-h3 [Trichonephila clavipes]
MATGSFMTHNYSSSQSEVPRDLHKSEFYVEFVSSGAPLTELPHVLRYECCEGFHQIGKNGGCFGVKPMTDVVKTARDLGATTFVDYLNEAGLTERLTTPGEAITLFAPTNEAFQGSLKSVVHPEGLIQVEPVELEVIAWHNIDVKNEALHLCRTHYLVEVQYFEIFAAFHEPTTGWVWDF